MKRLISLAASVLVIAIALVMTAPPVQAQGYPTRPIEIVVPFSPGGPLDLAIRFYADKWAEFLGRPVVVLNKHGANGAIGAKYVAQARPDGYTLLATGDSPMLNARLEQKDAGYDLDSFRYVFNHSKIVLTFSVKADSRWKSLADVVEEAKAKPGKIKYAAFGTNSALVMATEMLVKHAGVKLVHIPFKSSPEAATAVAGGNADLAVTWGISALARSGMIRVLAVADDERPSDYPNVPTLKELGFPIKYTNHYNGVAAPAKTPDEVIAKLVDAHNKVRVKYATEIKEKMPSLGQYPVYVDGPTAGRLLKEREQMFKDFYAEIGLKPE